MDAYPKRGEGLPSVRPEAGCYYSADAHVGQELCGSEASAMRMHDEGIISYINVQYTSVLHIYYREGRAPSKPIGYRVIEASVPIRGESYPELPS